MNETTALAAYSFSPPPASIAPKGKNYLVTANPALPPVKLERDVDFGVIPKTTKPSLYKPGAEKIALAYGLTQHYTIESKIEQIGRFSLHTLSTYGIMSEQTAVRVRQLIDVLLERGLLTADPERYNALFLTQTGNALMRGRGELHIRLPREKKPEAVRRTEELSADVDEKLFEKLRALRTKVAQRAGVPP